ncbi:MAG: hypothetical protein ABEK42_05035, partial [Thiohalorhabdaceae bacterium]
MFGHESEQGLLVDQSLIDEELAELLAAVFLRREGFFQLLLGNPAFLDQEVAQANLLQLGHG